MTAAETPSDLLQVFGPDDFAELAAAAAAHPDAVRLRRTEIVIEGETDDQRR